MKPGLFGLTLLIIGISVTPLYAAQEPAVQHFSPQGTVKGVRQAAARFSEPMVPFGDPGAATSPFEIDCPEKGSGRWLDDRNWVYDFDRDLAAGLQCTFRLKPGMKALGGEAIAGQREFRFSTGGPSVRSSRPYENEPINEDQIFILTLDAEPDEASMLQNVTFSVEGIEDRINVRIIGGKERQDLIKSQFRYRKPPFPPMVLVQSKQRFPAEARVSLIWGRGVKSRSGISNEKDQVFRFRTRKAFVADFLCDRENAHAGCIPLTSMRLTFSAPVSRAQAEKIVLRGPDDKKWKPHFGDEKTTHIQSLSFEGPFPERADFTIDLPRGMRDDSGRVLSNEDKFPLSTRTDRYPPLAKFSSRFGVLEFRATPLLPVTVRNLEPEIKAKVLKAGKEAGISGELKGKFLNVGPSSEGHIQEWLRRVASATRDTSVLEDIREAHDFKIPKPFGPQAFEVIGIPLKDPGLYVVDLESLILGEALLGTSKPMHVPTAVLVTNLSAHFKWGRESSVVWVTTLESAEPIEDAVVTVSDCREKVLWQGRTNGEGIARIETALPSHEKLPRCNYNPDPNDYSQMKALNSLWGGLFVTARTPDDMTFVHSGWNEGIEPWRFQLPEERNSDPVLVHTIFDRALLRAGETVHMKHVLRQHTGTGLSSVPQGQRPPVLWIEHAGSRERVERDVAWDGNGIAETTWTIPKEAKLGTYTVTFKPRPAKKDEKRRSVDPEWNSGSFRVEEFRIPLLKGTIQGLPGPLINPGELTLDATVQYLAGGGAGSLPIKLRSEIGPKSVGPIEGFDNFTFANGPVKEGIVRRGALLDSEQEPGEEGLEDETKRIKLQTQDLVLDPSGSARAVISNIPKAQAPREILTEMEFRDPNGEIQTVSSRRTVWTSKYLIGIKPDSWTVSRDSLNFKASVVDLSGAPVSGVPVKVDLLERKTYTHRKRLVGGFYAYEHSTETKRITTVCEGESDRRGLLICESRSPGSGNLILEGQAQDDAGRTTTAHADIWVAGQEEWWFEAENYDRIDLLPEKRRYEPGEKATFQVRMPFRSGTALVSVEREGVIDAWTQKISGKDPVIEVPIKSAYAPNVFVSVLVVRGRVAQGRATSMVDLGKPAYKLGIAEINVGWRDHELKVSVSTDRKVYGVRQKATAKIRVRTIDDHAPPAGSEVALVAVDEGLLELMPNKSWEILAAMMGRRGYAVQTATVQMQVIGKRHFGLKALPQGGGGGRQATRELFETLLLWKGRLVLDANGEASAEIPLNDSITSFRIVAVATGGKDLFGTGATSIQSNQELMVLSGLPPLVREGDRYNAGFTVRNASNRNMDVDVAGKRAGKSDGLMPISLSLKAGEAKDVGWQVSVPGRTDSVLWEVEVKERSGGESDTIRVSQRVVPVTPVRVFQAMLTQLEGEFRLFVERPREAIPGRGGLNVVLKPRISDTMGGVIDYMKTYPYTCMEQKISAAVALEDKKLWNAILSELPSHLDADGMVKYFSVMREGSPILTAYLLAISHEAGWEIPNDARHKMEAGLTKFVEGSIRRDSPVRAADLSIKKLSVIEALSRLGKAEAKLLNSITIEPNLWPTSAVIDWANILRNMKDVPSRDERIREAEQILRSRITFQGRTMNFSTEKSDRFWWLMVSTDVNAVRAILVLLPDDDWRKEIPKLVQGALARQVRGKWDLTTANAWGVLAMKRFSEALEKETVSGVSDATLSGQTRSVEWKSSPKGKAFSYPWPAKRGDLSVVHQGAGRPWLEVESSAAIPLSTVASSGFKVNKTLTSVDRKQPGVWSKGDVVRVRLEVEAQSDQTWVVISDPVPTGATILGKGLGRDSQILTEERKGWVWPAFEERSFESFKAYYEYVRKGGWTLEYTIRLNQSGTFRLPTTRVEALYFPEAFAEMPNGPVEVHP
jgi:alpha-2-macroglobulin